MQVEYIDGVKHLVFYHGTDVNHVESIKTHGLRPRKDNDDKAGSWQGLSNQHCVYLTTDIERARLFARMFDNGAVFQVFVNDDSKLRIDENFVFYGDLGSNTYMDWEASRDSVLTDTRWMLSIETDNLCSHNGKIDSKYVEVLEII
jgi:hypothetical protein